MTDPLTEIPRDHWGRPYVVPPEGGKATPYTRCTTYVDCLDSKYNLQKWEKRMVALGLAERDDLLIAVAASRDDKDKLDKLCDAAKEAAKGSAAGRTGTALHTFTEQRDRGTLDMRYVPAGYRKDIEAYAEATAPFEMVQIEQFGVIDDLKVGGTWDRLVKYQGFHYIADTKSGNIEYGAGKIAMQLAVYSRCIGYDYVNEKRFPLPDVDQQRALIIHLPAGQGRCELHWVDIAAGWEAVQLATQVRAWQKHKDLTIPFGPHEFNDLASSDPLSDTILAITDLETLRALWRAHIGTLEWGYQHTELAKLRADELTGAQS